MLQQWLKKGGTSSSHKQPVHPKTAPSPAEESQKNSTVTSKKIQRSNNHFLTFKRLQVRTFSLGRPTETDTDITFLILSILI